ncbi:hypothetical protein GCM10017688_37500 [Streptomyces ramulosus]
MAAVAGLGDRQIEIAGERMGQNVTGAGTGGGGSGIDHEKRAHDRQRTYLQVPLRRRTSPGGGGAAPSGAVGRGRPAGRGAALPCWGEQ